MKCTVCHHEIEEQEVFCKFCGTPTSPEKRAFSTTSPNPYTKPVSMGGFLLLFLAGAIPVVNLILFCIWGFAGKINLNVKHYARAGLIWCVLWTILACFMAYLLFAYLDPITDFLYSLV